MGKLLSFWSPYAGHGKTTASLCAIVGGFAMQYPELSIAISHTQKDSAALLKKLDNHACLWNDSGLMSGFGIEALKMYVRQTADSMDYIRRCGVPLLEKRISFYPNYSKKEMNDSLTFQVLTELIKREFEIVFLDLQSGNSEEALPYMQESDYVVIALPQDPFYIDSFWQNAEAYIENVNYGIVFGGCFLDSQYRGAYYLKKYGKRLSDKVLGEILWNTEYFDAMATGKALDFFFRNSMPVKKEENYEFIVQIKKTTERIQEKLFGI